MKNVLLILLIGLITFGCSSEDDSEDEKKELKKSEVTLTPPPGAYESGVAIKFTADRDDVIIQTKNDNGQFVSLFSSDCRAAGVDPSDCIVLNTSQPITYRLDSFFTESDGVTVEYTITPKQIDMKLNEVQMSEDVTKCEIDYNNNMHVLLKLSNQSIFESSSIPYLKFHLSDLSINDPKTIKDDTGAGLVIKASGETVSTLFTNMNYSTLEFDDEYQCVITLQEYIPGQKAKGIVSCRLGARSSAYKTECSSETFECIDVFKDGSEYPFGETIKIENTEWQCDEWGI